MKGVFRSYDFIGCKGDSVRSLFTVRDGKGLKQHHTILFNLFYRLNLLIVLVSHGFSVHLCIMTINGINGCCQRDPTVDTAVAIIMQVNSYLYIWRVELCINLEMY